MENSTDHRNLVYIRDNRMKMSQKKDAVESKSNKMKMECHFPKKIYIHYIKLRLYVTVIRFEALYVSI